MNIAPRKLPQPPLLHFLGGVRKGNYGMTIIDGSKI